MSFSRFWILACFMTWSGIGYAERSNPSRTQEIEVMFYNVENLFDSVHDEGKEDWTFLPKGFPGKAAYCETVQVPAFREECERSDWTEDHVELKIKQLKIAIMSGRSKLPEILGLAEVENANVVGVLAKELGYRHFVVSDSPDERGIDVALLYNESAKLKFSRSREHLVQLPSSGDRGTRNVLEVEFEVGGKDRLIALVNHWPSQSNPSTSRVAAARTVQRVIDERLSANSANHVIVIGDFNTLDSDSPHPFRTVLQSSSCRNPLLDARELFEASPKVSSAEKKAMAHGSYFYKRDKVWNNLDRIMVTKNLHDDQGLEVIEESFKVNAPQNLTTPFRYENRENRDSDSKTVMIPWKYNIYATENEKAGFSDHFAILVKLRI